MKSEPQQPYWLKPLGGIILGFTASAAFVVPATLLVGIPWLFALALVAGIGYRNGICLSCRDELCSRDWNAAALATHDSAGRGSRR